MEDNPRRRERWAYLTEGLSDSKRINVEVLLDNQNEHLHGRAKVGPMFEDVVTTANVGAFTTFSFPMVRRIFPRLIANDLVSVQPMNMPTGKIFFFDIKYATVGSPPTQPRVDLVANFSPTYAEAPEATQVPKLTLALSSLDVTATTKKLAAEWSMESEQDLFAYHGLSAENELMTAVGDEIAREIDRTIISAMFAFASGGNVNWHSTVPSSGPYSLIDPKMYQKTIYDAIVDANNLIFAKRFRNANWIVAGTAACARLEKLDEFRLFPVADPVGQIVYGPGLFGTISGRWSVYKDPWLDVTLGAEKILLGYKGTSAMDTGFVYAPYIPLLTTAPFVNPDTLTTVRAMMTRYAIQGVIPEGYATVTIIP